MVSMIRYLYNHMMTKVFPYERIVSCMIQSCNLPSNGEIFTGAVHAISVSRPSSKGRIFVVQEKEGLANVIRSCSLPA